MDALGALGAIYDGSDDDDNDEPPVAVAPASAAPTAAPAKAAASSTLPATALPDAGDLLSDMPDEVDWSARAAPAEEVPAHDAVGTRYNAVPLPSTMARDASAHNEVAAGKGRAQSSSFRPLRQGGAPLAAAKADGAGKNLLPPQLRRPNISTEDSGAWRTNSKRQKPASDS